MATIILNTIILIMISFLFISYYYQLYLGKKIGKLLLILEVGLKTMCIVYLVGENAFLSKDYLHLIPILLSILLFNTTGIKAKILFALLCSYILLMLGLEMYTSFTIIF